MAMMAVGCAFIAIGYSADPKRILSIVTGVLFIFSGWLRVSASRRRPG
jgi:hypothetical protein